MLKLVQNWLTPRCNPIGVDFGSDCLRMAQVQQVDGDHRLVAAASTDVPSHVRTNGPARILWFAEAVRDLLAQGNFKGRAAVLSLPASMMFIQHLRLPRVDEATLKKTLPFEARGKLPIDPSQCLMRHVIAGDIFSEQDPRCEVIVMAAAKEMVNQLLDSAARAKLDVIGMNVEPMALIDCFANVYRRKADKDTVNFYVDIGASATRAIIAQDGNVMFARSIPVGGDHLTRAVAAATGLGFDEAKLARVQAASQVEEQAEQRVAETAPAMTQPASTDSSFALLSSVGKPSGPAGSTPPAPLQTGVSKLESACIEPLNKLVDELNLCRRYHETTFSNKTVNRLIFVGGEARQKWMCQHVARSMQLAAQIGDPLVRLARTTEIGIESGIDRRLPQPAWAVALGLSMGPAAGKANAVSTQTERVERRGAA
jgi:type IV pilus assembly protein PilM